MGKINIITEANILHESIASSIAMCIQFTCQTLHGVITYQIHIIQFKPPS